VFRKASYLVPVLAAAGFGFLRGHYRHTSDPQNPRHVLYYVDPMHPSYKSDRPGTAPDCGMQLEPVFAEDHDNPPLLTTPTVNINSKRRQLYGIRLASVERSTGAETLRVIGRIAVDETRVFRVNVGTDGFVKETHEDAVGSHVRKDQHLASIYSPEFLSVSGGYLSANERTASGTVKDSGSATLGAASVQARADRLRNLGMSDAQIDELSITRRIPEDIYIVSPTDGFILARNISPGQRFERHTEFYRIADLRHVWILADVFGNDASKFRPGNVAHLRIPYRAARIEARVTNILPDTDPVTHATTVRLEADNPHYVLRPNMLVDVELPVSHPSGLAVPADALLYSGTSTRVFVEAGDDTFETQEVETGWSADGRVQIVKGLREGERVVSSGTFLVDSETRFHALKDQK
jgi:Cu(I)/Ag(I) efflux system membrane fusion protein